MKWESLNKVKREFTREDDAEMWRRKEVLGQGVAQIAREAFPGSTGQDVNNRLRSPQFTGRPNAEDGSGGGGGFAPRRAHSAEESAALAGDDNARAARAEDRLFSGAGAEGWRAYPRDVSGGYVYVSPKGERFTSQVEACAAAKRLGSRAWSAYEAAEAEEVEKAAKEAEAKAEAAAAKAEAEAKAAAAWNLGFAAVEDTATVARSMKKAAEAARAVSSNGGNAAEQIVAAQAAAAEEERAEVETAVDSSAREAAAAAAARDRAAAAYDTVCTQTISELRQLLSKEEEGSPAASELAGEIATALVRYCQECQAPAEQLAYLDELLWTAFENSAEWRAARVSERTQVVPPELLTRRCGRQFTWLVRGDARTAAHELLHRCGVCAGQPWLPGKCAICTEGEQLAALHAAAEGSSTPSEGANAFDTLDASQLQLLSLMVFRAVIDGDPVQLSFAELKEHVGTLARAALSEACTQQKVVPTEELMTKVVHYNHSCLAQQALATVLRLEVSDGGSSSAVTRLSHAHAVELYIHVLPSHLCPKGMLPVSCVTISTRYSGYAGAVGSARLVEQPHAYSSVSVFLPYNTQLLFRESRASSSGACICMSKLPARVLVTMHAAQRRATAAAEVEETAEGEQEVEVQEEEEAAAEGEAEEGEAAGEAAGGQDWSGGVKLTKEEKNKLNRWLVLLSIPTSHGDPHIRLGLPTVEELLDDGLAVRANDGAITIPIELGSRVSTQPGTMGKDHDAQKRAARLRDAGSQELRLPKEQKLASDTRAFSMRPLGVFEQIYGPTRMAAPAVGAVATVAPVMVQTGAEPTVAATKRALVVAAAEPHRKQHRTTAELSGEADAEVPSAEVDEAAGEAAGE